MTTNEQRQFDHLQEELAHARRETEDTRFLFTTALSQSDGEARLYRGLFWSLMVIGSVVAILQILHP